MNTIETTVVHSVEGIPVAELEVLVYPMRDDAFPSGYADDVHIRNIDGIYCPVGNAGPILTLIQFQKPIIYDRILEARETNCKTGRRSYG